MFKRIIFPTDFSESSTKALVFVLGLAGAYKSELIILFSYRLISRIDEQPSIDNVLLKKQQEQIATKKFEQLKEDYLEFLTIDHTFLAEVGFISDRISLAIQKFNIDLVVISESMQQKLKEKWEMGNENLVDRFHCPVLLVPSEKWVNGSGLILVGDKEVKKSSE